jgi:hypothetical protein
MKHMLLIYGNHDGWNAMTQESFADLMDAHRALQEELTISGELVDTNELPIEGSKIVRGVQGKPLITDGPFTESKEIVAGYYIVDCASIDRAAEIAARLGEIEFGLIEVRKISRDPEH